MENRHKKIIVIATLSSLLIGGVFLLSTSEKETWLPITKTEIVRIIAEGMGADSKDSFSPVEYKRLYRSQIYFRTITGKELIPPDYQVWRIPNEATPFGFAMVGKGEKIHSLKVMVPIVDYRDKDWEQTERIVSNLFKTVFPDWPKAGGWPLKSANKAMEMAGLWYEKKHKAQKMPYLTRQEEFQKLYISKSINGISSITFGIPPDIFSYTITARERCIRTKFERLRDPLGGIVCSIP